MQGKIILFGAMSVLLAACGGGVSTPENLRGTWGTECSTPTIRIDSSSLHILYPQAQDFDLTAASFDGRKLDMSFESDSKKITDHYIYEDNTIRADEITVDGTTFNGDKTRLTKCS